MRGRGCCLAGMLMLLMALSGCGRAEQETVTLTMIHAWGGTQADHLGMRRIYADFQRENPDIAFQVISMPAREEMLRKVEDMIMVGKMPDIVTFSGMGAGSTYDFLVENGMALDLMPFLEEDREFAGNVSEANLRYWRNEEQELFTIADVVSLSGGYWYNEDILRAAGVGTIPSTWEEFLAMCAQIDDWAQRNRQTVRPLQTSPEGYLYLLDQLLLADEGTKIEGNRLNLEEEEVSGALDQLEELYAYSLSDNEAYSYLDETRLFNEGRLAICINGVWGAQMISPDIPAKYALLPSDSGRTMACESASLGYVLREGHDRKRTEAAVRFLKYMLSEQVQTRILEETEQIPANPSVSLEEFQSEKPRLCQAASLVLSAEQKTEIPGNLWTLDQREYFAAHIFSVLGGGKGEERQSFAAWLCDHA